MRGKMPPMWWLWSLALAQTEVCSSHPVERWAGELEAVAKAHERFEVARAGAWLEAVMEGGRCLSEVAPLPLMVRLAELRAVQAMYDQDQQAMEAWVRQRMALAPDQPWSVPPEHPIHRFAEEVEPAEAAELPEGWVLAAPKRGGVFVDGAWQPRPELVPDVPHLVQAFDGDGERVDAAWVLGTAFDEAWLEEGSPPDAPRWFQGPGVVVEERPTWKAARKDTLAAYQKYLAKEPTGEHAAEARRRIDDLRWAAIPHTPEGAQAYIDAYPNGRNRGNAEAILQGVEFQRALDDGSREALQLFLGRYPQGVFAAEAQRQLEAMAWSRALAEDTEQAYARYRVRWPKGVHREEARLAHDERAWQKAEGAGRTAMESYLRAWPAGMHAPEARAFLEGLAFVRVLPELRGDEALTEPLVEVLPAELEAIGFTIVEADAKGVGRVVVAVKELPMGVDATRLSFALEVWVASLEEPLLKREVLIEPSYREEELERLVEATTAELRRLEKWMAQP